MLVGPTTTPKELLPGVRTEFMKAYKEVPLDFLQIATVVPSTLRTENYAWLGQSPQVREFIGERIPKGLSEFSYSITNRKWENTISVDHEDIEDEQYGQLKIRAGQLGSKASMHRNILSWAQVELGFSTVCYDGQDYFSASHAENLSGTQSNTASGALTATNYGSYRASMMNFLDDTGIHVGIMPTDLIVPPALEYTARLLLNADFVASDAGTATQQNVWKGSTNLKMTRWLTSASHWYLEDSSQFLKPVIFQEKEPMTVKVLDESSDSERAFMRDEFLYGTRARYATGFADWRVMFGSSN